MSALFHKVSKCTRCIGFLYQKEFFYQKEKDADLIGSQWSLKWPFECTLASTSTCTFDWNIPADGLKQVLRLAPFAKKSVFATEVVVTNNLVKLPCLVTAECWRRFWLLLPLLWVVSVVADDANLSSRSLQTLPADASVQHGWRRGLKVRVKPLQIERGW